MNWNIKTNPRLLTVVASVLTGAASAGVTYVATNKLLEKKFQDRLEIEIQETKAFWQNQYSTPVFVAEQKSDEELIADVREATDAYDGPPEDLVGKALDAQRSYRPTDEETEDRDIRKNLEIKNIFANATPPSDVVLDALLLDRDETVPYLITREEFLENEPDHEQLQFTYWEGDGILVDDRDEYSPVDNNVVAGEENLLHFGYGSGDEHIVYVRNKSIDPPMDLHITRSTGKYADEVMTFADDSEGDHLQHSQKRFRLSDE